MRTLNSLGAALENAGDSEGAADAYTQAIALGPNACDARCNLAGLELKRTRFSQAEEQFRTMLRQCPEDAGAHLGLGVALAGEGDSATAQTEFQRALELDPQNFSALYHLGQMAIDLGQTQRAIDLLQAAVTERPGDLDTRERLAMAFAQAGRPADALAQLREAARLAPDQADLHALLSQVLAIAVS